MRPIRSKTNTQSVSRTGSPRSSLPAASSPRSSSAMSSPRRESSPAVSSRPVSVSATPRSDINSSSSGVSNTARKDRRNLVRQALENAMTKSVQKEKPRNKNTSSLPDQDSSSTPVDKTKDKTVVEHAVEDDNSNDKDETRNNGKETDDKTITNEPAVETNEVEAGVNGEATNDDDEVDENVTNDKHADHEKSKRRVSGQGMSRLKTGVAEDVGNDDDQMAGGVDHDKSKRVSGQGMPRKKLGVNEDKEADDDHDKRRRVSGQGTTNPKTPPPKTKKFHNLRAISTPQVNKTVLGENVTFLGESIMNMSAITVLSPPSSINDPDSRRSSSQVQTRNKDDTDAVSFRFKKGSKDLFDKLVENNEAAAAAIVTEPASNGKILINILYSVINCLGKRKKDDLSPEKEKSKEKKTKGSKNSPEKERTVLESIAENENSSVDDQTDGVRRSKRRPVK